MKPTVFKMGGSWIWTCSNGHGGTVGDEFREDQWRSPWDVCLGAATKHATLYHVEHEVIEEFPL